MFFGDSTITWYSNINDPHFFLLHNHNIRGIMLQNPVSLSACSPWWGSSSFALRGWAPPDRTRQWPQTKLAGVLKAHLWLWRPAQVGTAQKNASRMPAARRTRSAAQPAAGRLAKYRMKSPAPAPPSSCSEDSGRWGFARTGAKVTRIVTATGNAVKTDVAKTPA